MGTVAAGKPHLFGIRHHGPGCARSLLKALDALQPDCLLVEGAPEAEGLLRAIVDEAMQPPVALLSYCPDDTTLAVYHPFAVFSPEWQALRWAMLRGVPVRFIDLPLVHALALEQQQTQKQQDEAPANEAADTEAEVEPDIAPDGVLDDASGGEPVAERPDTDDPLDWLARAAGHADGESWWNHMVEERGDGEELFAAIAEAMLTLRLELGEQGRRDPEEARREALREAHMRQCLREAQKAGHERIAVVCGAWHLAALQTNTPAKADQQLLKGLPRVKVHSTWIPWTYRHLARSSGYGAGVTSPGWYEHLWSGGNAGQPSRAVGWLARVARLMRDRDLDCSSAHLIEAARLAETLAALRDRPQPGLDDLNEAVRTVLCMGDDTVLRLVEADLVVGDRLGTVPADVPAVPLQRDVEQAQKSLRLKPEALSRTLDLDLRNTNDLARSRLLHRLRLLDVPWGEIARTGRNARGTFHEVWSLQWRPEYALRLIEASRWGRTVLQASTARVMDRAAQASSLQELAALVDQVLLAELPDAVEPVTQALERRAAGTGDAMQLLAALPPLANVFRYGSVRQTDGALVAHVLDGLIVRACIGLPLACTSLDDSAAEALREQMLAAHGAVALRAAPEQSEAWRRALGSLRQQSGSHALLAGLASRLLLDDAALETREVAQTLELQLSRGAPPAQAAAWLDGFLNRNAAVLLHDPTVWALVDGWLAQLSEEHFLAVLPLTRRTFAAFSAGERRDLGVRARGSAGAAATATPADAGWDEARAALPLPTLRQLIGLAS
ncbi:DUF5682 family protein [Aquabacterium sp. A7-Y]|uniref:DUF5682 family protein n=1 Tax=Aquabacterium sp. A7-Y TaxID=1349605 RepID=UPI00223E370E|nr:DUF5682 family protein [Aquabacterium sp. A7-Y]MCW7539004.1 DUF5682 family protein [Aquabacterium sp. A7-Y]